MNTEQYKHPSIVSGCCIHHANMLQSGMLSYHEMQLWAVQNARVLHDANASLTDGRMAVACHPAQPQLARFLQDRGYASEGRGACERGGEVKYNL